MTLEGLKYFLTKPHGWFFFLVSRDLTNFLPDEPFLKASFRYSLDQELDLANPRTFNQKLQWLKLHDRKPIYTQMVDKYAVRKIIADRIGEQYSVPLAGGPWDRPEDIDFDALPAQFVLKCTHDSGGLVICRDKDRLDRRAVCEKLARCQKRNYYWSKREWPYKDVPKRIIAEEYMQNGDMPNLNVYKIFNFGGVPTLIQTIQNDKTREESIDYFDTEWKLLDLRQGFPNSAVPLPRPETLPEMLRLAARLSEGFPFLRTDFYEVNGRVYFSEFTFYSDSGFGAFDPEEWDEKLGRLICLPGFNPDAAVNG